MTVEANDTIERQVIDGVGPYPFSFRIFNATDLAVTACSDAEPAVPTLLTHLTHYTVTGVNEADGGEVTLTADAAQDYDGYTLDIRSNTPATQPTSIRNTPRFLPEIHEDAYDRCMRKLQDVERRLNLCIRYPDNVLANGQMSPISSWISKYLTVGPTGLIEPAISIGSVALTSSLIGTTLQSLQRTQAEITASVTPTNYAYAPLDVRRYGATGDGSTNDAPAFQQAIDVARTSGGCVYIPTPEVYFLLETPLDCTYVSGQTYVRGLSFRSEAGTTAASPSIVAKHTGHIFDCSGNLGVNFHDLNVGTDTVTYPKTCFFLARNAIEDSQAHRLNNCRVHGKFTEAIVYNYGSEEEQYNGCRFTNIADVAHSKVMFFTQTNIRNLTSTFITIATGVQSTISHEINGGSLVNNSDEVTADVIYIDNCDSVKVSKTFMFCGHSTGGGRALVYVETINGPTNFLSLRDITGEQTANPPAYGIYVGDTAGVPTGWTLDNCLMPNATRAIRVNSLVTPDNWNVTNIHEQASHGMQSPGVVQGCTFNCNSMPLIFGTSAHNVLIGQVDNWTITTRDDDQWIDQRTTKTWAATTSALTITGGLAVNRGKSEFAGRKVTVTLVLQANTSIVCAAGTAVTGLPANAVDLSSHVQVYNFTDKVVIGGGCVEVGSIFLPAINETTDVVVITATYFAA